MTSPSSTFIWSGAIHIGDEPGIYGNAHYSGLSMEFPLTVRNFNHATPASDILRIEIGTEDVNVLTGYLGHLIIIRLYSPDPQPTNPYKWKETIIKNTDRIANNATSTVVEVPISASSDSIYISLAIEIDTDVSPGLYDDFLVSGLSYTTLHQNVYVNFGFRDSF